MVVGLVAGGVAGYAFYASKVSDDGDMFAMINVPVFTIGGAAIGALLGWVIAPRASNTSVTSAG